LLSEKPRPKVFSERKPKFFAKNLGFLSFRVLRNGILYLFHVPKINYKQNKNLYLQFIYKLLQMMNVRDLLSKGKIKDALSLLEEQLGATDKDANAVLTLIYASYHNLEDKKMRDIIYEEDARLERNNLINRILSFIDLYEMDKFNYNKTIRQLVRERHQNNKTTQKEG
jgi:hypothetical protein